MHTNYHFLISFLFSLLFLLVSSTTLLANDGSFYAQGGNLIPLKETRIQMAKEVLTLEQDGDYMHVSVDFTFYNPDDTRELLVGFVTPPAGGDVTEKEQAHPQVSDYIVLMNGEQLSYNIHRLEQTGFKSPSDEDMLNESDFVYHSKMVFQPGNNQVQHRYTFRGGSSVLSQHDFSYRLTTCKMWAGGAIGDFTLNIKMEDNSFYTVNHSFLENKQPADWYFTHPQAGRVAQEICYMDTRAVKQINGTLQFKAQHFSPDYDLEISILGPHFEVAFWMPESQTNPFKDFLPPLLYDEEIDIEEIGKLNKRQLWLYRNYLFAKYGHNFNNKELAAIFGRCTWYIPNTHRLDVSPLFTDQERNLIRSIQEAEKKFK